MVLGCCGRKKQFQRQAMRAWLATALNCSAVLWEILQCITTDFQRFSVGKPPRGCFMGIRIFLRMGKILIIQHGLLISCVSLELFKTRLYKALDNLNQAPFPTKDWMKSSFKAPSGVAYSMILCRDMKGHFQESFC